MKKYKTTKKHPFGKGIKFDYNIELPQIHWESIGWIKEKVKQKRWVIDFVNNWKLVKLKGDISEYKSENVKQFKSKKAALKYVLAEAKGRFKDYGKANVNNKETHNIIHNTIRTIYWTEAKNKGYVVNTKTGKNEGVIDFCLWHQNKGWIAEPVEEPEFTKDDLINFTQDYIINSDYWSSQSNVEKYYIEWLKDNKR